MSDRRIKVASVWVARIGPYRPWHRRQGRRVARHVACKNARSAASRRQPTGSDQPATRRANKAAPPGAPLLFETADSPTWHARWVPLSCGQQLAGLPQVVAGPPRWAALAQMVRALDCGSRGPPFDPGRRYHHDATLGDRLSTPGRCEWAEAGRALQRADGALPLGGKRGRPGGLAQRPMLAFHPGEGNAAPVSSQMQVQAEATAAPTTPIGPTSVIATAVVAAAMVASPVMATVPMAPPAPPSSGVRGCRRGAEGKAGKPRHPNGGGCHRPDRCHCVHAKHGGDRDAADQSAFGAMANGQSRMQQSQSMSCVLNHL